MMMTCLSKNIFCFNSSGKPLPKDTVKLYNDINILYNYIYPLKERLDIKRKFNKFIELNHKTPQEIIKKTNSIIIGHGSISKAEIFQNFEKYIPTSIYYLLTAFETEKIINKKLIEDVKYYMSAKNNTNYYLIKIKDLLTYLEDNYNNFIYLTYY